MDYEKKYKEALERAEKALEVFGTDKCEGARQIFSLFPELKESEDERIRKWLIGYFHQYKEDGMEKYANGLKVEAIIAWLEKQGEKKPADLEEFISELSKQFPDVSFAKLSRIAVRVAKWAKPADSHCSDCTNVKGCVNCTDGDMKETEKPVWSEDDEMIALSIEQVMNCASLLNIVPEKVDKRRIWLKSLKNRCTWKPSEEQLDALKRTQTGVIQFSVLQNLYNDLKKLSQS